MVKTQLMLEGIDGQKYWFSPSTPFEKVPSPDTCLLPNYDEYIVGYTNRHTIFDDTHIEYLDARGNVPFNRTTIMTGQIVGIWKQTLKKYTIVIVPSFFELQKGRI